MKLVKVSLAEKSQDGVFEVYDVDQKEEKFDGEKAVNITRLVFTGTPEDAQIELDKAKDQQRLVDSLVEEKQAIVDCLKNGT